MSRANEEYEIQLYSFSLNELKHETKAMITHEITRKVEQIFSSSDIDKANEDSKNALNAKKEKIVQEIINSVEKKMEKYYKDIDKHMAIPPYVLLPENKIHDVTNPQYTDRDEEQLRQEFEEKKELFEENIGVLNEMDKIISKFTLLQPAIAMESEIQEFLTSIIHQDAEECTASINLQNILEIADQFGKK
ncbi:hypothetical protein DMENIID0001_129760 [Sergentomyia squamirostris]